MNETEPTETPENELEVVFERARGGDRSAVPRLRELLDDDPASWAGCADLADVAREAWVKAVAGEDLAAAEVVRRQVQALCDKLAGPGPPPLIRLLAGRAVASWLQLHHADCLAAGLADASTQAARFALERLAAAERRQLRALSALATAGRLLGPVPTAPEPLKVIESEAAEATVPAAGALRRTGTANR